MEQRTAARLERLVRTHQADNRAPSVAASVVRDGDVVWSFAVGQADVSGVPATASTPYRIGSITKTLTAILVMQLRDAGALQLDDPLARHVPEVGDSRVTIRQALSHLSGLQREPPGDVWVTGSVPDMAGLLASFVEAEWVLPSGRRFHYSNLAYALLGRVVEVHTGRSWSEAVSERLLRPLGMLQTYVDRPGDAAVGYFVHPHSDAALVEQPVDSAGAGPAMQVWSTVGDVGRLAAFLAAPDPSVLAAATVEEMTTVSALVEPRRWTLGYGLGVMLHRRGERILVGHAGAMPGFLAAVSVAGEDKVGAAVLTNTGRGADPVDLAGQLVEATLEEEPAQPTAWAPPTPVPAELAGILGSWWLEGVEVVFAWRNGSLEARPAAAPDWREPTTFVPVERDRLRTAAGAESGEWLLVLRDDADGVAELRWATYRLTRTPEAMLPG